MNRSVISKAMSLLGFFVTSAMVLPLLIALYDGSPDWWAFLLSILVNAGLSAFLWWFGTVGPRSKSVGCRDAFVVVTCGWCLAALLGSLPFLLGGYASLTDSIFESMSGFTTTGATIFSDVESLPRGILMWRCLSHWLGGIGILALCLVLMPMLGVGGMEFYKAETPGPLMGKMTPRISDTVKVTAFVYVGLTSAETLLLWFTGMSFFDSVCHSMSTIATGGFGNYNTSIAHFNSPTIEWIITFFMFISALNFSLHYLAAKGDFLCYVKDDECKLYFCMIGFAVMCVTLVNWHNGVFSTVGETIRRSCFQFVSVTSTTGFIVTDYDLWAPFCRMLMVMMIGLGGCLGSTAGGVKYFRIIILYRRVVMEMRRLLQPKRVSVTRLNNSPLSEEIICSVVAFFVLYCAFIAVSALVLSLTGCDMATSISGVITCFSNAGPGLSAVGPTVSYGPLNDSSIWVLTVCMLVGRLELLTVLMLFYLPTWRHGQIGQNKRPMVK